MNTGFITTALAFLIITGLSGCKEDIPGLEYRQDGYIRGTIAGVREDSTALYEKFNFTQREAYETDIHSTYQRYDDGSLELFLNREDFSTGSEVSLTMYLEEESDSEPLIYFDLNYIREDRTIYYFRSYGGGNQYFINNLHLDLATRRFTGDLVIENPSNSTGSTVLILIEFDAILSEIVN